MANLIFSLQSPSGNTINIDHSGNSYTLFYPCPSNSSCTPYLAEIPQGKYSLEVWGANGGASSSNVPAGGGYSYGELVFTQNTQVFIYLGGSGGYLNGGWNGGGQNRDNQYVCHGGGASDIRLVSDSLYNRVIVAGGSGGSSYNKITTSGAGGGVSGSYGTSFESPRIPGEPGNQTHGGKGGYNTNYPAHPIGGDGIFGYGGNSSGVGPHGCGGGGGGWYGGGGSANGASGSGGSGYAFTTDSYKPSGYALGAEYYLSNSSLLSGNSIMPQPIGINSLGHFGNGVARITYLDPYMSVPTPRHTYEPSPVLHFVTCNEFNFSPFLLLFTLLILLQTDIIPTSNIHIVL